VVRLGRVVPLLFRLRQNYAMVSIMIFGDFAVPSGTQIGIAQIQGSPAVSARAIPQLTFDLRGARPEMVHGEEA
jgi:hypothetical protein